MHMARTEGVRGMMKGNWTNCVRIIPNSAMKFFTFEQLCRWAGGPPVRTLLCGGPGCLAGPRVGGLRAGRPPGWVAAAAARLANPPAPRAGVGRAARPPPQIRPPKG
jgi:hypothetical protein